MLDDLEGFQLIWKVSEQSVNFQPGNFLYNLEVYNQSGKFLDSLERQRYVNTWTKSLKLATNKVCKKCNILVAITIYALLAYVSRKRFTHFWHLCRGNDLRALSGKFLRVTFCRPENFDFLCLCLTDPYLSSGTDFKIFWMGLTMGR